jgi:hypothetical protein
VGYKDQSDQALVEACLDGDERAAREIVVRFERPVFSLIYRMVRDRERAEDLAQETFVRTLNNLRRYDPSYKFSSWLFKIGYNLTIEVADGGCEDNADCGSLEGRQLCDAGAYALAEGGQIERAERAHFAVTFEIFVGLQGDHGAVENIDKLSVAPGVTALRQWQVGLVHADGGDLHVMVRWRLAMSFATYIVHLVDRMSTRMAAIGCGG